MHRRKGSKRDLVIRAGANISLRALSVILLFVVSVILARTLGTNGYGEYAYIFAIVTLLGIPVKVGIPAFILRGVAKYEAAGDWSLLRGLLKRGYQVVFLLALITGTAAAVVYFGFFSASRHLSTGTFIWGLVFMLFASLTRLSDAGLIGFRRPLEGSLPYAVARPALLIAALLLLVYAFRTELSPSDAMALHAGATMMAFLLGAILLLRVLPAKLKDVIASYRSREWARSIFPLSVMTGIQLVNNQVDVMMLGSLTTTDKVGIYRAALRFSLLIPLATTAAMHVLSPHVAVLYSRKERQKLQRFVTFACRLAILIMLPLAIVYFIAPHWLMGEAYGQAFASGGDALRILTIGRALTVIAGPTGMVIKMIGHEKSVAKVFGLSMILNVVLNAALIPSLGMLGSATATAFSCIVSEFITVAIIYNKLGLWTLPFGFRMTYKHQ